MYSWRSRFNGTNFWSKFLVRGVRPDQLASVFFCVWARIFDSVNVLIKSFVSSATRKWQQKQTNDDVSSSLGKKMNSPSGAKSLKATCTPKSCEDNYWELTHQTMTKSTIFRLNLSSVWTNGLSWCWSQNARMQRKWASSMEAVDGALLQFRYAACDELARATNVFVVEANWADDGLPDQSRDSFVLKRSSRGEDFRKVVSFRCS